MLFLPDNRVRLTPGELNEIRSANARQGHVIQQIRTRDELLRAIIQGMPDRLVEDMLEFMETDSSPLTQGSTQKGAVSAPPSCDGFSSYP